MKSLARPDGNATGFTILEPTITGKWLELLKEIAPRVNRAAFLFNPATTPYANIYLNPFKAAAASLGFRRLLRLFTTRPNSNPPWRRRHANQMAD